MIGTLVHVDSIVLVRAIRQQRNESNAIVYLGTRALVWIHLQTLPQVQAKLARLQGSGESAVLATSSSARASG
jgi:hypothetical protein